MLKIGLIKEGKTPPDSRVAMTPEQCIEVQKSLPGTEVIIQPSPNRCIPDQDFLDKDLNMSNDLSNCDVLLGVKEVPIDQLIEKKTYFFFSHTKKKQPYNQKLMHALIEKKIRMIDYEAMTYEDGKRIIGFGFFAGVVGAHNGLMTYGKKHGLFNLKAAHQCQDMEDMMSQYKDIVLPPIKVALTGSGKVSAGMLHVMQAFDIKNVEPQDFLNLDFEYPVYTLLKGGDLYENTETNEYHRDEFHKHPEKYSCKFKNYITQTDILLNGIYWDEKIERLFEKEDVKNPKFKISVIADITCDIDGSVPINLAASTTADPVYGIDKHTLQKVSPFQNSDQTIDLMAVDNLPNELPRDASAHFGDHVIKYIVPELLAENSEILDRATICKNGKLGPDFEYLADYAYPS